MNNEILEEVLKLDFDSAINYLQEIVSQRENESNRQSKGSYFVENGNKGYISVRKKVMFYPEYDYYIDMENIIPFIVEQIKKYEIKTNEDLVNASGRILTNFFGIQKKGGSREEYYDKFKGNEQNFYISQFRNVGCAHCTEKAALGQNLFSLFGLETYYMISEFSDEDHAFNIVKGMDNYYLVDNSIDRYIFVDGRLRDIRPTVKKVDNIEEVLQGNLTIKNVEVYDVYIDSKTKSRTKKNPRNIDYRIGNIRKIEKLNDSQER